MYRTITSYCMASVAFARWRHYLHSIFLPNI